MPGCGRCLLLLVRHLEVHSECGSEEVVCQLEPIGGRKFFASEVNARQNTCRNVVKHFLSLLSIADGQFQDLISAAPFTISLRLVFT